MQLQHARDLPRAMSGRAAASGDPMPDGVVLCACLYKSIMFLHTLRHNGLPYPTGERILDSRARSVTGLITAVRALSARVSAWPLTGRDVTRLISASAGDTL